MNARTLRRHAAWTSLLLLSQCSPYAGTEGVTKKVSLGYGNLVGKSEPADHAGEQSIGIPTPAGVATWLIGFVVTQVDKQVTEMRTGDYAAKGVDLQTRSFPENGFLVVVRTIADPEGKYPQIASVGDFISHNIGTPGGDLNSTIANTTTVTGISPDGHLSSRKLGLSSPQLSAAVKRALANEKDDKKPTADTDRIALLAVCPILKLDKAPANASRVYGVGLSGLYFPLMAAARFGGESSDLFDRIAKAKEAMTLEVYGPNGSGYTTGIIKVPLVWSPPHKGERAEWVTGSSILEEIKRRHDKDGATSLGQLFDEDAISRLKQRTAFVSPRPSIQPLLRADAKVSETSEATGWIVKAVDEVGGLAKKPFE